jgi:hypothetical protein
MLENNEWLPGWFDRLPPEYFRPEGLQPVLLLLHLLPAVLLLLRLLLHSCWMQLLLLLWLLLRLLRASVHPSLKRKKCSA